MKKCEICQKEFQKLGVHKANAHVDLALECSICDKKGFKNSRGLGAHKANVHNEQTRARMLSSFEKGHITVICPKCDEILPNYGVLGTHNIIRHSPEDIKEKFLTQKSQTQIEKMKDPEFKTRCLSDLLVEDCSIFWSDERRQQASETMRQVRLEHPESCARGGQAYSEKMKLLFPRIVGIDYSFEWDQSLKKRVRDRDDWKCIDCDTSQNELRKTNRRLAVHHLDSNKDNLDLNNLVTVCFPCHMKRHHIIRKSLAQKIFLLEG